MTWFKICACFLTTFLVAACSASEKPDLAEGEMGRVVRVIDGDQFALHTGQMVRLAEIEAPSLAWKGRPDQAYAKEAKALLSDMLLGRDVSLKYGGLRRDKYDRAIAHAYVHLETGFQLWVNGKMIELGGARVRSYPDNQKRVAALLKLENEARQKGMGLWSDEAYSALNRENFVKAIKGFHLIEGVVESVQPTQYGHKVSLNLPLEIRLYKSQTINFGQLETLYDLTRKSIRIRGYIGPDRATGKSYLRLDHPAQIEEL